MHLIASLFPLLLVSATMAVPDRRLGWSRDGKLPFAGQKLFASAEITGVDNVKAFISFSGREDGSPTEITVKVDSGLTLAKSSQYLWHIHTVPVAPGDTACTSTLAHLDPLKVGEMLACNPELPEFCQEGDLSGKHGKLKGTRSGSIKPFTVTDEYLRWFPPSASLLGRSITIHYADKTRIACGNITSYLDGTADRMGNPTYRNSWFVPPPRTAEEIKAANFVGVGTPVPPLPYPLPSPRVLEQKNVTVPIPAYPLSKAVNVKLTTVTRTTTIAGHPTAVALPSEKPKKY